jgi:hypothetical protein
MITLWREVNVNVFISLFLMIFMTGVLCMKRTKQKGKEL